MQITRKNIPFIGASCALITPFRKDGSIDKERVSTLIEYQLNGGTRALTVLGTTGEAPTVSDKEHHDLLSLAVRESKGRLPIIGGCGSNDTHHAVYLAQSAEAAGCDALLVITPYYNKASARGLVCHFERIAEAVSIPIILYNVPQRTGVSVPFEVYRELAEIPNVVAVKDASSDISMASRVICELGDNLCLYSGNDELTLPLMAVGAKGVISVASNVLPREMASLCDSVINGDVALAASVHARLLPAFRMLSCEVNPIPVKYAASLIGLCEPFYRLPMCEPAQSSCEYVKDTMSRLGFNI